MYVNAKDVEYPKQFGKWGIGLEDFNTHPQTYQALLKSKQCGMGM